MVEMVIASKTLISINCVTRLIAREGFVNVQHVAPHPDDGNRDSVLEIFSFCGSGPKCVNEITVTFLHVPFLASVTTHGAERTLSSLNVLIS
jgi:hypothetical protein